MGRDSTRPSRSARTTLHLAGHTFESRSTCHREQPMPDPRFTLRLAVRALRAAPLVSLLAILCIGLGIGGVTTVYSTASAFTFHPLPQFVAPDRLVLIGDAPARSPAANITAA